MCPMHERILRPRPLDSLCLCADGENHGGAVSRSLGVQPRHDQLGCLPAAGQPERGGEAAVDVSGSQLDAATVSTDAPG